MALNRAGTICIHLDDHQMTLLAEHAKHRNTPIQICARDLLVEHLEQRRVVCDDAERHRRLTNHIADGNLTSHHHEDEIN